MTETTTPTAMRDAEQITDNLLRLRAVVRELRTLLGDDSPERTAALREYFRAVLDPADGSNLRTQLTPAQVSGDALLVAMADLRPQLNEVASALRSAWGVGPGAPAHGVA